MVRKDGSQICKKSIQTIKIFPLNNFSNLSFKITASSNIDLKSGPIKNQTKENKEGFGDNLFLITQQIHLLKLQTSNIIHFCYT